MRDLNQHTTDVTHRRSFFGRHVGARPVRPCNNNGARTTGSQSHGPDWPGTLKGRHRHVFDIYDINEGSPLGFTNNFLAPNESATAVMIFRHKRLPYALGSAMWEKYKIGESFNIPDPETRAPAVKNPYFQPKPGVLPNNDSSRWSAR